MKNYASDIERVLFGLRTVIREANRHNVNSVFSKLGRIQYHVSELAKLFYEINSSSNASRPRSTSTIKYDQDNVNSRVNTPPNIVNENIISVVEPSKNSTQSESVNIKMDTLKQPSTSKSVSNSQFTESIKNSLKDATTKLEPITDPEMNKTNIDPSDISDFKTTATTDTVSQHSQVHKSKMREKSVPSTPIERVFGFGSLAAGLIFGRVKESTNSVLFGAQENSGGISEENANRLADSLSRMRGAALKLGQMLRSVSWIRHI